MLRKKSIYRKELTAYMCISDLYIKLKRIDVLHEWCRDSMTSSLTQIFIKFNWVDWD